MEPASAPGSTATSIRQAVVGADQSLCHVCNLLPHPFILVGILVENSNVTYTSVLNFLLRQMCFRTMLLTISEYLISE